MTALTRTERDEMRTYHRRWPEVTDFCLACSVEWSVPWPCEVVRLLDALDAAEAEVERLRAENATLRTPDLRMIYGYDAGAGNLAEVLDQRDEARTAIDRVRALHRPEPGRTYTRCVGCVDVWPCDTIRALDGEV